MVCKNCGKEIADDSIFCPNCGERTDDKIECKNCKTLVDSSFRFCPKCGAVLHKKLEETSTKKETVQNVSTVKSNDTLSRIERILSPSIMLAVTFVLFICSFFIGLIIKGKGDTMSSLIPSISNENWTSVFDEFSYISETIKSLQYDLDASLLKFVLIFMYAVLLINILSSFAMFIVSFVVFANCIAKHKEIKISKFAVISFAVSIFTICSYMSLGSLSMQYVSGSMLKSESAVIKLNASSNIGIIVPFILFTCAVVVRKINEFKAKKLDIGNVIVGCIVLVFLTVILIVLTKTLFSATIAEGSDTLHIKLSSGLLVFTIGSLMSSLGNHTEIKDGVVVSFVALWILQLAMIILIVCMIAKIIYALSTENKKVLPNNFFTFALTVLSIIYLIVAVVEKNSLISKENELVAFTSVSCVAPIIITILSVMLLIGTLTYYYIKTNKNTEQGQNDDIDSVLPY